MIRPLVLAVAAALAGCASIPPETQVSADPALRSVPEFRSQSAALKGDLSIERWWIALGDAELTRLIEEALARNEDLEEAAARVQEAQASLDVANAARIPTLDLEASTGRSQATAAAVPPGGERRARSNRVSLEAGYEVDLWGKLSSASAAARQRLLATEWARSAVEWGLTARLAEGYFGLLAVDRQIEISESVRELRLATVVLRQRERSVGVGSEFDLRRAEAELYSTEATLASLGRQRTALERAVTVLLGRTPQEIASAGLRRARLDESQPYAAVLPQGGTAELLARRPDVRQAESELAAANHSIAAARAATLPSVRLAGSLGSDARTVADLFSGPAAIWSLGAGLAQPLIDGGRARARFDEEHARGRQSLASYRKVVAGAVLDVQEAYATLDLAQRAFSAERERVAALARARHLAQLGYDNGALGYLDVLDADRNLYQAQLQQVAAYRDQLVGQVSAFKALGGGYTSTGSSL